MSDAETRLGWIREKSALPNGVTIEHQAWSAEHEEWIEASRVKGATEFQFLVSWGAKLGHFTTAATLEEALDAARRDR